MTEYYGINKLIFTVRSFHNIYEDFKLKNVQNKKLSSFVGFPTCLTEYFPDQMNLGLFFVLRLVSLPSKE